MIEWVGPDTDEPEVLSICTYGHHETEGAVLMIVLNEGESDVDVEYDICEECWNERREN